MSQLLLVTFTCKAPDNRNHFRLIDEQGFYNNARRLLNNMGYSLMCRTCQSRFKDGGKLHTQDDGWRRVKAIKPIELDEADELIKLSIKGSVLSGSSDRDMFMFASHKQHVEKRRLHTIYDYGDC